MKILLRSALAALVFLPVYAPGAIYLYNIGTTYSGTSPAGAAPWATATFTDVGNNQVQLDMQTHGLTGNEFIGAWYFNFSPVGNLADLTFARLTSPNPGTTAVEKGSNVFSAGGGGRYDIVFDFPESVPDGRFTTGLTTSYLIGSTSVLDASMFNFLSSPQGGNGTWYTAAHVQSIGKYGDDSGWIGANVNTPVPEPTTYLLLGSLLVAVGTLRWFRNTKKRAS